MKKKYPFCTLLMLIALIPAASVAADLYKYTDGSGSVVITDRFEKIPVGNRASVKVIKDDSPPKAQVPVTDSLPAAAPQSPTAEEPKIEPAWKKYLKPVLVCCGVVAGLIGVLWLISIVGRKTGAVIFIVFSLLVGVLIYRMYLDQLAGTYQSLKDNALNIKKNVETRPVKTEDHLKNSEDVVVRK